MRVFFYNITYKILSVLTVLILLVSFKIADDISFNDEPLPFKPAGYYINNVIDERPLKSSVAQLIIKSSSNKTTTQNVDLQGGPSTAVSKFIEHNLVKNASLRPAVIGIKGYKLTETELPGGVIDGHIKLQLSFGFEKDYGTEHLIDYEGGLHYTRAVNNITVIEPYLRTVLKNGLVYFNNWINANSNVNRKLAQKVNVSFNDYTEKIEGDTIYYSRTRPLTWADFKSTVKPAGTFDAEVMPFFGYDQQAEIIKGTIYVKITLKVYVPKSACWTNYSASDAYGLNHEQRHFDITKIIAEQFKQKIAAQNLTPDNFESIINMQYLDSYRDMNTMQKAYDKETAHSRNETAQQAWNTLIDKNLKSFTPAL